MFEGAVDLEDGAVGLGDTESGLVTDEDDVSVTATEDALLVAFCIAPTGDDRPVVPVQRPMVPDRRRFVPTVDTESRDTVGTVSGCSAANGYVTPGGNSRYE
ncbi:MAG: hypothetical protein V5A62_15600 [Haloarculaceae archaeon]